MPDKNGCKNNEPLDERWAQAFRKDDKQVATLLSNMLDGFAYCQIIIEEGRPVDFEFLDVNKAFKVIIQKKRSEVIGKRAAEVNAGFISDRVDWIGIFARVALEGVSITFETFSDAMEKWLHVTSYCPEEGSFVAIFEDITDRRNVEIAYRENEQRLLSHVENTPMAVVEWDSDFLVTRWAGEAERMFGWSASEVLGRPLMDLNLVYEPDIPILQDTVAKLTDGVSRRVVSTNRNITKEGRVITCTWYNSVMMDEKGKTASVLSLVLDITSQIETERELKENAERLTWSNAELQQFAYVASHDLQEPLRMVVSYLTLLDRRYSNDLDPQALEFLHYAVEGGERMRALIDALLAYSRVDTKGKEFGLVDMGSVMEDVIQVLSVPIGETKAEITVGPMPTIAADGSQMFQLMQNLVNNAIKFNEGPQPIIRVYADKAENLWKFAVTDNGIGIDAKYSEKIFQMFQRLHTKEEYPGNGVGLAIAKKIAERHGGRIWVESEEGMGAAFYFTIDEKAGS